MKTIAEMQQRAKTEGVHVNVLDGELSLGEFDTFDLVEVPGGVFLIQDDVNPYNSQTNIHLWRGKVEEFPGGVHIKLGNGMTVELTSLDVGYSGDNEAIARAMENHRERLTREGSEPWRAELLTNAKAL